MSKELVISATPHETRVAILEDGQLCEIYIEREKEFALVGSIYKGRVTRVLPGMQSAFVQIGLDSDAFLYVSDFLENLEEYDHIVTTVEGKVQKMEQQGGQVFAAPASVEQPPAPSVVRPPEAFPGPGPGAEAAGEPARQQAAPPAPVGPVQPAGLPMTPPSSGGPSYSPRDRPQGGFGRDRGRRGGRWGGRRGGPGGDRRQGRDLPPSKYASNRPYEPRPQEPRAYGPPPAGEPILLPGESLAKYKDRVPAAPAAPPIEAQAPSEVSTPQPEHTAPPQAPGVETRPEEFGAVLPSSLYVERDAEASAKPEGVAESGVYTPHEEERGHLPAPSSPEPATSMEGVFGVSHAPAGMEPVEAGAEEAPEPAPAVPQETHSPAAAEPGLSEEEMVALSEQLAEAKHEEAQAEAEEAALGQEEIGSADTLAEHYEMEEGNGEVEPLREAPSGLAGEPTALEAGEAGHGTEAPEAPGEGEAKPLQARVEDRSRARFQRPVRRGGRQHGGRFPRPHERHAAPRRTQLISEMLKAGQEIIVQIAKEPLGKKGARITSHVALPGRYLVYMPTVDHIGVSRKIASADNRSRLRRLVAEAKTAYPGGFIVRTAAESATDEEVRSDVEFLGRTWGDIIARSEPRKAPTLLHRDLNLVERILRDYLSHDYSSIWIDNEEEFSKVVEFVSRFQPKMVGHVKLYTKETPIFEEFGIQQELDKALRPKVWLKSGGYIVINHTEALVAIDVNTGKYVGRGSTRLEDTIVKTNLEAVKEIVRQIRLRDLGGIIVLDFIDMEERRNREKVMHALDEALRSDRAPSKVLSFNEFGLVAITRKRTKQSLERVLCQPCPYCTGSGMVKSLPTICYEIQAEARKMSADLDTQSLTLRVHPEIAKALKTRESNIIEELEQATRKSIIIQSDPTLHWEQYDIY
jgi:Rne/Rng family ribonuclease